MLRKAPLLAALALAATACSSPDDTTVEGAVSTGGEARVDADVDVPAQPSSFAPAAAPAGLVATARIGDVAELVRRAEAVGGTGADEEELRNIVGDVAGDVGFASLVNRDGAADAAFVLDAEQSLQIVGAVDLGSMRTVARNLPSGTTRTTRADGSLGLEVSGGEYGETRYCSVEPTTNRDRTRLVCSTSSEALEGARAYLARGLSSTIPDGEIRFDLAVEALRARHGAEARGALSGAAAFLEVGLSEAELPILRDEAVRAALMVLVRDVLDDVAALVDELAEVSLRVQVDATGVRIDADLGVRQPSGSLTRAMARLYGASSRVPADLVEFLPGGAGVYGVAHADTTGFEDMASSSATFMTAVAQAAAQLSQGDGDAMSRAFAVALRPMVYDTAVAIAADGERRPVTYARSRYASAAECERAVAAHREILRVLRRPGVARALDQATASLGESRPRFSEFAEFSVRGAPAGAYAYRAPSVNRWIQAMLTTVGLPMPEAPAAPISETLVIPNGTDLILIQAADVRAAYAALSAGDRVAGPLRAALEAEGRGMAFAMRLGDFPTQDDRNLRAEIGEAAANAVITMRVADTGTNGDARFEFDMHLPTDLVRGFAQQRDQATTVSPED